MKIKHMREMKSVPKGAICFEIDMVLTLEMVQMARGMIRV